MARILVVDDEPKMCVLLEGQLRDAGHVARSAGSGEEALAALRKQGADVLLTDLKMEGMDGLALLARAKELDPDLDVVIMTAYATTETAVEAMRRGAFDYILKPFKTDELLLLVRRIEEKRRLSQENRDLRRYLSRTDPDRRRLVGSGPAMGEVLDLVEKVAPAETTVLIQGESGTGKELAARAIHAASRRADGPFIAINCSAIPETLQEGELFGYEKGAFTGAERRKLGHFALAAGGTLFLDEVGEISPALQVKLLRALEEKQVQPLGSVRPVEVDTRVVAATNRDLGTMVREGSYREDLYYRLNVFPIRMPPLRARLDDLEELVSHFLRRLGFHDAEPGAEVIARLRAYPWPGNVRELRNVIERATILAGREPLGPQHLVFGGGTGEGRPPFLGDDLDLHRMEGAFLAEALARAGGNKSRAAEMLGITRRALYSRLEKHPEIDAGS
jgi:two-component system response regulator HydG